MRVKSTLLGILTMLVFMLSHNGVAFAATFNQNNIIADSVFNNSTTMSVSYINSFLNQFPKSCISPNNGFSAPDPTGYNPTNGFLYGNDVTAGQVIYDASQAYGINPQVLLTTLQKEQSLVNGSAGCSTLQYAGAMGYGCPDGGTTYSYSGIDLYTINGNQVTSVSNTCVNSSLKVGFSQQVIHAAWLLEFGLQRSEGNINWAIIKGNWNNSDDPQSCYGGPMTQGTWQRCPSGSTVYYDGYTTIDGASVHVDNGATAALYWYTPHFSGNQNFFNIFNSWFGSTQFPFSVVQVSGSSTLYVTFDGMKQQISDTQTYNAWGFSKYTTQTISQSALDSMPTYTSPLTRYINPAGTNNCYYVDNGKFYSVSSTMFAQWGHFNWQAVSAVYPKMMGLISNQGPLTEVVKTASSTSTYLMDGGTLRPFSSSAVENNWEANNINVISVSSTLFSEYPQGTSITSNLVKANNKEYLISDNNAFLVSGNQSKSLPSSWAEISVDPSTIASRSAQNLSYTVTSPDNGAIYLLDGNSIRPFATYNLFLQYANKQPPSLLDPDLLASMSQGSSIDRSIFGNNGSYGMFDDVGNLICFDQNTSTAYNTPGLALSLQSTSTFQYLMNRGCHAASPYMKITGQTTIFVMSAGKKLAIPSLSTLFSYDPSGSIVTLGSADQSLFPYGTLQGKSVTDGTSDYYIDKGYKYPVPQDIATAWHMPIPQTVGSGFLNTLATATPLTNHVNINGAFYLVDNGIYHMSPTTNTTLMWGLTNNTTYLSPGCLSILSKGSDLTRIVQTDSQSSPYSGALYTVDNGRLYLLSSMQELANYRILGGGTRISDNLLKSMGADTAPVLNSYLLKSQSGYYYVIDNGYKRSIDSNLVTNWVGNHNPTIVSNYFLNDFPTTSPVPEAIYANNNPTIYYMSSGKKIGYASYTQFTSSGQQAKSISNQLMTLLP